MENRQYVHAEIVDAAATGWELSLVVTTKSGRRRPDKLAKSPGQLQRIAEACCNRYFGDCTVALKQQSTGQFHAFPQDVLVGRQPGRFLERANEMELAQSRDGS